MQLFFLMIDKNQPVFVLLSLTQNAEQKNAIMQLNNWLSAAPFELVSFYRAFNPEHSEPADVGQLKLSDNDIALLRALSEGKTNKEIAKLQDRRLDTVASHLKRLFKKMGVRSRSEAVAMGLRASII
jgi:DNA-binding NarL/FixJ family response regulator